MVIEAKRLGAGVEGALAQAESYLKNLGIMRDIIVTDGIRYRMYSYDGHELRPVAYANLSWLKKAALQLLIFSRSRMPVLPVKMTKLKSWATEN